ncbi:unnamed protein product [Periconia digitata]|uniref:Uncharacterized protein n=1 Tax=Periconia digitata TaxID=1303443 RepID=A0A9W4UJB2_9PLEO|nr:unnamed protein product [Periconia digitata]
MNLSQTSDSSTIEDPTMNRQTTKDDEGQPISNSRSPSGSVLSSPRSVAKESRGMKRRHSTETVLEEEALNLEAKRPKLDL